MLCKLIAAACDLLSHNLKSFRVFEAVDQEWLLDHAVVDHWNFKIIIS